MNTYFASPERASDADLKKEIEEASKNLVVDELLHSVGGVLAVLNEHRQILAVNEGLIEMLGIPDAGEVLGLRPGEAVHCVHCNEMPGGCGTSRACASCGAVVSIVSSLASDRPEEGTCALSGAPFKDCYSVRGGIDTVLPVDMYVPGCPPKPEAIVDGIAKLITK